MVGDDSGTIPKSSSGDRLSRESSMRVRQDLVPLRSLRHTSRRVRRRLDMKRRWFFLGLTGLSCASLAASACGDDTTNGTSPDAGPDSTTGDAAAMDSAMAADT